MYLYIRKKLLRLYQTIFNAYVFAGQERPCGPRDRLNSLLAGRLIPTRYRSYKSHTVGIDHDAFIKAAEEAMQDTFERLAKYDTNAFDHT